MQILVLNGQYNCGGTDVAIHISMNVTPNRKVDKIDSAGCNIKEKQ